MLLLIAVKSLLIVFDLLLITLTLLLTASTLLLIVVGVVEIPLVALFRCRVALTGGLYTTSSHTATVTERGSDTTMVTVTPM